MTTVPTYRQGADLPDYSIQWYDSNGDLIDFSTGYTFQAKVGTPGSTATITKTTGISGAATSPNVTITWATTGELNTLDPGIYTLQLKATRSSDSKDRYFTGPLRIDPAIA